MNGLSAFFRENAEKKELEIDFVVSPRFLGENGMPIAWKLRAVMPEEMEAIRKAATKADFKNKDITFDTETYQKNLIAMTVVYPDLENAALQDNYGVTTPQALLSAMLNGGEYSRLSLKVSELNGGELALSELKEQKETVKN